MKKYTLKRSCLSAPERNVSFQQALFLGWLYIGRFCCMLFNLLLNILFISCIIVKIYSICLIEASLLVINPNRSNLGTCRFP